MVLLGLCTQTQLQAEVALYREQFPQQLQLAAVMELATILVSMGLPQVAAVVRMAVTTLLRILGQHEILVVMVVARTSTSQVVAAVQELTVWMAFIPKTPMGLRAVMG